MQISTEEFEALQAFLTRSIAHSIDDWRSRTHYLEKRLGEEEAANDTLRAENESLKTLRKEDQKAHWTDKNSLQLFLSTQAMEREDWEKQKTEYERRIAEASDNLKVFAEDWRILNGLSSVRKVTWQNGSNVYEWSSSNKDTNFRNAVLKSFNGEATPNE